MQQFITREQLWERFGQLDPFQQQTVATLIEMLLAPKPSSTGRDKRKLLDLSSWSAEDIANVQEVQDRFNEWNPPVS